MYTAMILMWFACGPLCNCCAVSTVLGALQ